MRQSVPLGVNKFRDALRKAQSLIHRSDDIPESCDERISRLLPGLTGIYLNLETEIHHEGTLLQSSRKCARQNLQHGVTKATALMCPMPSAAPPSVAEGRQVGLTGPLLRLKV